MPADPHAVQLYVDGSHRPLEKRRSGYAGIVLYPEDPTEHEIIFEGFTESTINRMELAACIAALKWARDVQLGRRYSRLQIFSDSKYVVDGQHLAAYWQRDGWRTGAGRPVDNWRLWKEFLSARGKAGIRVDICKVINKSTPLLRKVDTLAKEASRSHARPDNSLVKGKIGRAMIKGAATMFPAANQVCVVRIVSSKTVGPRRENRFVFELFDETTRTYVSKHFGYCAPEIGSDLHRQRAFRVKMNDDPQYPQILEVIEEVPLPKKPSSSARPPLSP